MLVQMKLVIIAIITSVFVLLSFGLVHYHGKYISETQVNAIINAKNGELISQINEDSQNIRKLAIDSKMREDAASVALVTSQKKYQNYVKQAQIMLLATAQSPNNLCQSSDILYNDFIKDNSK